MKDRNIERKNEAIKPFDPSMADVSNLLRSPKAKKQTELDYLEFSPEEA